MPDFTGRPIYLQVADDLRRQMLDGSLTSGAKLPSIAELTEHYDTSPVTVRQALNLLKAEGLIYGHQGKGNFVRPSKPRRVRAVRHLYSSRPTSSPLAESIEKEGGRPSWLHQSSKEQASPAVAQRLGIAPGDSVMMTTYRFFSDDEPIMLSTSYEPLALTESTPVEWPENGPITGVVPRFDRIGIHIAYVQEEVTARAAQPFEAETLRVPTGIPIMAIQRTYFTDDDQPVETADVTVSADTYALSYVVPIPDQGNHMPGNAAAPEPPPVVAGIVTSDLGVLVGRRNDGKPPWTFIAGEIEPGESPTDAVVREVKEETGLRVRAAKQEIGRRVHPKTGRTMIYLACSPARHDDTNVFVGDEDELAEVRWVSLQDAETLLPGMYEPVLRHLARKLG